MGSVADNLKKVKDNLPKHVRLVAVSKFHPEGDLLEAYNAGQRVFGESRMQELTAKNDALPKDIEWHFIGNLQTNKVKSIVPFIDTIHSVDSWRLLQEIGKQAEKIARPIKCLLEVHIAQEETKQGMTFSECRDLLNQNDWKSLEYVKFAGVMGMATFTDDHSVIREEFRKLKSFFEELKQTFFEANESFCEISMGMSNDYEIAIEEGATLIRVGSSIFGVRE